MASPPDARMSASTCFPCASRTSPKTTLAPSRAHNFASAAPCPRAPPLMSATLPSSLPILTSLHWTLKVPSPHLFEVFDFSPPVPLLAISWPRIFLGSVPQELTRVRSEMLAALLRAHDQI